LGGAIFNLNGSALLHSITFASNSVATGPSPDSQNAKAQGGAIYNIGYHGSAALTAQVKLINCLLARSLGGGDLANNGHASAIIEGFNNLANLAGATIVYSGPNLVTSGIQLEGGTSTGPLPLTADPQVGPLADNGGPTFTHGLLPGSPAIDAGDAGLTPPPFNDQRGVGYARFVNGRVDVGAYEVQPPRFVQEDWVPQGFHMIIRGEPSETLRIEWNTILDPAGWQPLNSVPTDASGLLERTDTTAVGQTQRFYRVLR
jgi:hypothetical protein